MITTRRELLLASTALAFTTSNAGSQETKLPSPLYMVRRTYAADKNIAALRSATESAHRKHLLKFADTIAASAIISDVGQRVGSVSISDSGSRAAIERYVHDDPFTRAGIYSSIAITPIAVIKIDGSYNRAPAWFAPQLHRRQRKIGFNTPVMPTRDVGAKTMMLVRRFYATDHDISADRKALAAPHTEYLKAQGKSVVTASMLDDAGNRLGVLSVLDSEDFAGTVRFVNDDPFTQGRVFSNVEVERIDLYKLDGSYDREWPAAW